MTSGPASAKETKNGDEYFVLGLRSLTKKGFSFSKVNWEAKMCSRIQLLPGGEKKIVHNYYFLLLFKAVLDKRLTIKQSWSPKISIFSPKVFGPLYFFAI